MNAAPVAIQRPSRAFGVHSEVGRLRKVLVCRPGLAQMRLTPANFRELLFDDVLWVTQAKNDHYAFVNAMDERGVEVLEMHELLATVVADTKARDWVLDRKLGIHLLNLAFDASLRFVLHKHRGIAQDISVHFGFARTVPAHCIDVHAGLHHVGCDDLGAGFVGSHGGHYIGTMHRISHACTRH